MKHTNKTLQKIISICSLVVAVCLIGTVGYLVYEGITNPSGNIPVKPSSSLSDTSSVPDNEDSSLVTDDSQPTPKEIAATSYTDSPYYEASLPILVNASNPIATGLEELMRSNNEFVKITAGNTFWIHKQAQAGLQAMIDAAKASGHNLSAKATVGGYRTLERQKERYDAIIAAGGTEQTAHAQNAVPGYSESGLGLSVDFSPEDASFANTGAYTWLVENCTNYGFILRFPQEKEAATGVSFQPYHFRYVGINHAKAMQQAELCLEEYLNS